MKKISKVFIFILVFILLLSFSACALKSGDTGGFSGYSGLVVDGEGMAYEKSSSRAEEDRVEENTQSSYQAGLITAAAWDDNQYYGSWQKLFLSGQTEEENGKFLPYVQDTWGLVTTNRVSVTVKDGEQPVVGAKVSYFDGEQKEYAAVTDACGKAYIFPTASEGRVKVTAGNNVQEVEFTAEERDLTVETSALTKDNLIKLMFVVDVTGSMGDEITYLKAELADVINRVVQSNQGVRIDLAFLFYRDNEDKVKFSYADFVDVKDPEGLSLQQSKLSEQVADGGGDYPEAVDEALELAISKNWGDENSTKLIFHVLDAPPHDEDVNKTRFESAVKLAAKKGIRLCPVLCSGAEELCEYLMRQEAIYTGGTFVFITDHSGIGGEHLDPDLPNAVVEKLNDLMVRLINGYHTGTFADPVWWNAPQQSQQSAQGE